MVLKIMNGQATEFIECDRFEYAQTESDELRPAQIHAWCWSKSDLPQERYFREAYLLENGKTVEHIIVAQAMKAAA